jgi:serine phosphatase RsbU (regulator of sigma subunit)
LRSVRQTVYNPVESCGGNTEKTHDTEHRITQYCQRMKADYSQFGMKLWTESHGCNGTPNYGDFCDCIQVGATQYAMISGDVAGHGTGVRAASRRLHAYTVTVASSCISLSIGMMAVDTFFARTIRSETIPFASLFIAIVDLRNGDLRYVSAGHEPALLIAVDGVQQPLDPTGGLLGIDDVAPHHERALRLVRESLLVVVSDGITESRRRDRQGLALFGSSGVVAAVRDAMLKRRDPARAIYTAARRYANNELTDDSSILVSRLTPLPQTTIERIVGSQLTDVSALHILPSTPK